MSKIGSIGRAVGRTVGRLLDVRVEREFTRGGKVSSSKDLINERLKAIRNSLQREELKELLQQVGEIYYDSTMTRFQSQSAPSGRKWAAWSALTRKLRTTGIPNRRPPAVQGVNIPGWGSIAAGKLIWTGKLIRAIKVRVRPERATVQVGLNSAQVPYAWRHQQGYGKVPQRKFLGYTQKANAQALKAIRNYMSAAIGGLEK